MSINRTVLLHGPPGTGMRLCTFKHVHHVHSHLLLCRQDLHLQGPGPEAGHQVCWQVLLLLYPDVAGLLHSEHLLLQVEQVLLDRGQLAQPLQQVVQRERQAGAALAS